MQRAAEGNRLAHASLVALLLLAAWPAALGVARADDWGTAEVDPASDDNFLSWQTPQAGDDRRLLLSDEPETIGSDSLPLVLWHDGAIGESPDYDEYDSSAKYRVFFWHVNDTGSPLTFAVTVQNKAPSTTLSVTSIRGCGYCTDSGDILGVGKDVALACLHGCLGQPMNLLSPSSVYVAGGDVETAFTYTVPDGYLIGGVIEFNLSGISVGGGGLKVRTVACSTSGDPTALTGAPPAVGPPPHNCRGAWNYSQISLVDLLSGDPFDCTGNYTERRLRITDQALGDQQEQADSYDSDHATSNKGNYGVLYDCIVSAKNPGNSQAIVDFRVAARNTGYAYGGAGGQAPLQGIPAIRWDTSADATEAIPQMQFTLEPSESRELRFYLMNAGAATLPASLHLRKR